MSYQIRSSQIRLGKALLNWLTKQLDALENNLTLFNNHLVKNLSDYKIQLAKA